MLQPMNKRGSVGIRDGKNWQAIYNIEDSTPLMFGPTVWEMLQENWNCLEAWGKELLGYTYWEEYINKGLCPYCGKFDVGLPCQIIGNLYIAQENGILAPDPNCKFHRHKPKSKPISSKNGIFDGLWVEWSYIVNPKEYMLEVIRSVRDEGTYTARKDMRKWEQPKYQYHSVGLYSLFNNEPDWERIQQVGLAASAYYWEKHNPQRHKKSLL
jgi:hypothetical protein